MTTPTHIQITHSLSDIEFILDALEEHGNVKIPTLAQFEQKSAEMRKSLPDGLPDALKDAMIAQGRGVFDQAVKEATELRDRSVIIRAQLIQAKRNPQEFSVPALETSDHASS